MTRNFDAHSILELARPRTFEQFIGNSRAKATFRSLLLAGDVKPGFLVNGPYGCGKTTLARLIARSVACVNRDPESVEPCHACPSCGVSARSSAAWGEGITVRNCADYTMVQLKRDLEMSLYARSTPIVLLLDEFHRAKTPLHELLLTWLEDDSANFVLVLSTTEPRKVELPLAQRLFGLRVDAPPTEELVEHLVAVCRRFNLRTEMDEIREICAEEQNVPRTALKRVVLSARLVAEERKRQPSRGGRRSG